ncbi:MAG: prolipoprotein diacylglyceryl transferase [Patescibacteria group bacterium]
MFWNTYHPQAIAATVGSFSFRWYGLIMAAAVFAGLLLTIHFFKKKQVDTVHVYNLFFLILGFGLVGGRLGHIIGEWGYYVRHLPEIIKIWHGGLAIHGVLFGALLAIWMYSHRKKMSFWLLTDLLVIALPLMQSIGRWGNYFNQELYGRPTGSAWGMPIDMAFREPGYESFAYFHPLFLYESLLMLGVFCILMRFFYKAELRPGVLTLLYFLLFSVTRFTLDFIRLHKPMIGALSETQWLSVIIFFLAVYGMWRTYRHEMVR